MPEWNGDWSTGMFRKAAENLPSADEIQREIEPTVAANTEPGRNFSATLATQLHSFLVQWVAAANPGDTVRGNSAQLGATANPEATCICPRFSDLPEGTIIADLTCPIHGVDGTDPG